MRTFGELTPAEVSAVSRHYQAGNGYVACGLRFDISQHTVRKCLAARNITPRFEGRIRRTTCMLPYIEAKMRETKLTYAEIAEAICYEPQYVQGSFTGAGHYMSSNMVRALADVYGWDYETMMRERDDYFGQRKRKTPCMRKYSEAEEQQIVDEYKRGYKTAELAAAHGCSHTTVHAILCRHGIEVKRRPKSAREYLPNFVSPSLAKWFEQSGMTFDRLAPFVGLGRRTLIDRIVGSGSTLRLTDNVISRLAVLSRISPDIIRAEADAWWESNRGGDTK